MKQKINANIQVMKNEIENTMDVLYRNKFIYYYNLININVNGEYVELSCNNHISSRANCGKAFTTFQQFEAILYSGNFGCILYDGSLIKLELCFKNQKLISHSYLWWSAPYKLNTNFTEEQSP